ncbi:hypothetical protein J6590_070194 [Homalodisca vitripennis]|nr:hypothetical protein J6590_070194 [Homalodisca vitripennis]
MNKTSMGVVQMKCSKDISVQESDLMTASDRISRVGNIYCRGHMLSRSQEGSIVHYFSHEEGKALFLALPVKVRKESCSLFRLPTVKPLTLKELHLFLQPSSTVGLDLSIDPFTPIFRHLQL